MRQRVRLAALAAVALTGCGGFAPARPTTVEVPVAVPCVTAIPVRPELLADAAWASGADEFVRVRALMVDRAVLKAHVGTLEAVLMACASKGVK